MEDTTTHQALKPQMTQFCRMIHISHTYSDCYALYKKGSGPQKSD